jgi:hypothetical protein
MLRQKSARRSAASLDHPTFNPSIAAGIALPGMWLYYADPTANLSSYKTHGFVPQPGMNRGGNTTPLTTYFETSISREMDARGYRKVDAIPDLLVNFNANVQEKADVESTPAPMGYYGYRGGLYAGGLYGGSEVETVHYKVGAVNIDVLDASKRRVVWEGRAEGELTDQAMQNSRPRSTRSSRRCLHSFRDARRPSGLGRAGRGGARDAAGALLFMKCARLRGVWICLMRAWRLPKHRPFV